jgi:hypothetical protein
MAPLSLSNLSKSWSAELWSRDGSQCLPGWRRETAAGQHLLQLLFQSPSMACLNVVEKVV